MESIIKAEKVAFSYRVQQEEAEAKAAGKKALSDVSLELEKGQFVVVIGRNGSGKSTLARLLNALLHPSDGVIWVKGMDTREDKNLWEIRRTAGMVFQNPDNQIVGTIVEEDVAFGPENLGFPPEEIRSRVENALRMVGIYEYKDHAPHLLSGGQKQRIAIAGILAMKPECIILDEATSMLDPIGRKEVMGVLRKLNKEENITIVHITHHMDEAAAADRVIVTNRGHIELDGKPAEVFSNVEQIKGFGLDVPQVTELLYELNKEGFDFPLDVLTVEDAFEILAQRLP